MGKRNKTHSGNPGRLHRLVIVDEGEKVLYGYFDGDQPVELYCDHKEQRSLVGNVYAGSVYRIAEGIKGAFLHTVDGDCFLPGTSGLKGGDILAVQIFKDPVGRKLPVAGTNISINGKYFVFTFANKRFGVSKKIKNHKERERLTAIMKEESQSLSADLSSGQQAGELREDSWIKVDQEHKSAIKADQVKIDYDYESATKPDQGFESATKAERVKKDRVKPDQVKEDYDYESATKSDQGFEFGIVARTNAQGVEEDLLRKEFRELTASCRRILKKSLTAAGGSLLYGQVPYYIQLGLELPSGELQEIVTDSQSIFQEWKDYYDGRQDTGLADKVRYYEDDYPLKNLYRFDHHFQAACQRYVWLKSGGSIVIDPTEAMTVIDVNSGAVTRSPNKADQVFLSMNLEAAREIARQIRLRNISGIILVDFINMKESDGKTKLMKALADYCSKDRSKVRVIDYTALGLVEMTRDKSRKPLRAQLGKMPGQA